jgi:hypothetical protein
VLIEPDAKAAPQAAPVAGSVARAAEVRPSDVVRATPAPTEGTTVRRRRAKKE